MDLTVDLDSRILTISGTPPVRGEALAISLRFVRCGVAQRLGSDIGVTIGAKDWNDPAGSLLANCTASYPAADGSPYTASLSLNTTQLLAKFTTGVTYFDTAIEVKWQAASGSSEYRKSHRHKFRVDADVMRDTDASPTDADSPDTEWVAHGHSQSLTSGQKTQANTNIGSFPVATATTKGDVFAATGAGVIVRVEVGTNGQRLEADSTAPAGVSWKTPAAGTGTVTTVGWTGGIISIANPTSTPAFTIAGTSGGLVYFDSASTWASSGALAANALMIGGGAGAAPSTVTTGTNVLTALGVNVGSAGAFITFNGDAGTPSALVGTNISGTGASFTAGNATLAASATILATGRTIAMTGDGTWSSGSFNGGSDLTAAMTLATVNTTTGSFGDSTHYASFTVNGKGLVTASSQTAWPTFNQDTTGSAAKWTTARNLAGNSVDGSANVAFANKFIVQGTTDAGLSSAQFLGALGTGIVKNTTTTGVLSIASAGTDYQTPTGTPAGFVIASQATGDLLYASGATAWARLGIGASSTVLTGGTTPTWSNTPAIAGTNFTGTAASLTAGHVTTNADLTGPITSSGNATSIASQTGIGSTIVVDNAPTFQNGITVNSSFGNALLVTGSNNTPEIILKDTSAATALLQVIDSTSKGVAVSSSAIGLNGTSFTTNLVWDSPASNQTITFKNVTGNVVTTGDTGTVTSTMILDGTILNADINASAAIADTKLATIATAGKVSDSALSANVPLINASNTYTGTTNSFTIPTTTGTTTSAGVAFNANSLTTGTGLYVASSTLTTGKAIDVQVSGTAAAAGHVGLNIAMTGSTSTNAITTTAATFSNTRTNATSGTNIAQTLTASGATTANIAQNITAGFVNMPLFPGGIAFNSTASTTAGGGFIAVTTGDLRIYSGGVFAINFRSTGVCLPQSVGLAWAGSSDASGAFTTTLSQNASGALQIGTTTTNALGSLLCVDTTQTGKAVYTPDAVAPALNAGAAVSVTTTTSTIAVNGASALTLANGTNGQVKTMICTVVTAAGTATCTPTTTNGFTTVAFSAVGQTVILQYTTVGGWAVLSVRGAVVA